MKEKKVEGSALPRRGGAQSSKVKPDEAAASGLFQCGSRVARRLETHSVKGGVSSLSECCVSSL